MPDRYPRCGLLEKSNGVAVRHAAQCTREVVLVTSGSGWSSGEDFELTLVRFCVPLNTFVKQTVLPLGCSGD